MNEDHPMQVAAKADLEQLSAFLDRKPALREHPGWFGRQPLHVADRSRSVDCFNLLLKRGAYLKCTRAVAPTDAQLHFVVGTDSSNVVDRLVKQVPNVTDCRISRSGDERKSHCRSASEWPGMPMVFDIEKNASSGSTSGRWKSTLIRQYCLDASPCTSLVSTFWISRS